MLLKLIIRLSLPAISSLDAQGRDAGEEKENKYNEIKEKGQINVLNANLEVEKKALFGTLLLTHDNV